MPAGRVVVEVGRPNVFPPEEVSAEVYLPKDETLKEIDISVGNIMASNLPDESCDLVSCFNVAQYLVHKQSHQAFFEVQRILKEGGYFLSDGAVFQKLNGKLGPGPITGFSNFALKDVYKNTWDHSLSEGLHPMVMENGVLVPASMQQITRKGTRTPQCSFIGAAYPPREYDPEDYEEFS